MALEVYYPADIRNALLAAEQASGAALLAAGGDDEDDFTKGYRTGYRAVLVTIALAFGLLQPDGRYESRALESSFLAALVGDRGFAWRENGGR